MAKAKGRKQKAKMGHIGGAGLVGGYAGRRTGFAPCDCANAAERQAESVARGGAGRGEVGARHRLLRQGEADWGKAERKQSET